MGRRMRENKSQCDNRTLAQARRKCEHALFKCFPLDNQEARGLHAKLSRRFCQVLDCRIRAEQGDQHETELMPAIAVLILMMLFCFVAFSFLVCCLDFSDDIFEFLAESNMATTDWVRKATKAKEKTREKIGMDRTKQI